MVPVFFVALYVTLFVVAVLKALGRHKMRKEAEAKSAAAVERESVPLTEQGIFQHPRGRFALIEEEKP